MVKNWAIAALIAVIAIGGAVGAFAATRTVETTANVEVTVWQRVSDGALFLSTKPEGGTWTTHNTPLDMSTLSSSGRFRQGSAIKVAVPVTAEVIEEPQDAPVTTTPTPTPVAFTPWTGQHYARDYTISASAEPSTFTDEITTIVLVLAERNSTYGDRPALAFACRRGALAVSIGGEYEVPISNLNDEWTITYRFDRRSSQTSTWSGENYWAISPAPESFITEARTASQVVILMTGWLASEAFTFDLTGVFDTPAQENLDRCGTY